MNAGEPLRRKEQIFAQCVFALTARVHRAKAKGHRQMVKSAAVLGLVCALVALPESARAEVLWTAKAGTGAFIPAMHTDGNGVTMDPSIEDIAAVLHTETLSPATLVSRRLTVDNTLPGPMTSIIVGARVLPGGASRAMSPLTPFVAEEGSEVETADSGTATVAGAGLLAIIIALGLVLSVRRQAGEAY